MGHTIAFHTINLAKKMQKIINLEKGIKSLSYSQAAALSLVVSNKSVSQSDIASHLHLEPASIVALIDGLEKLNLIKREASGIDRRRYVLVLTKEGRKKAKEVQKQANILDAFLKTKISKKKAEDFTKTVNILTDYLDRWKGGEK